jgi:glc operon protein GlcG
MDIQYSTAQALVNKTVELAQLQGVAIAVAVADAHGEVVAFARMDGAAFHAAHLAPNKAYTAARDRQPTANLAKWAKETGKDMGYWSDPKFTGIAGGLPLTEGGEVVGAIGISGLSEEDDAALAQAAIDALAS